MLNFWGYSKSAQPGGNATPGNWMPGCGIRPMEKAGPGVIRKDLEACNEYLEGLAHAARVECPALLILGERDMLSPSVRQGSWPLRYRMPIRQFSKAPATPCWPNNPIRFWTN